MRMIRFLFLFLFVGVPLTYAQAPSASSKLAAPPTPTIKFEDASDKAGVDYTHSFGSRQLGSLLEGTGAGCVWFDYNNDGLPDLYVVSGRTLPTSMTPHPLSSAPGPPPQNH